MKTTQHESNMTAKHQRNLVAKHARTFNKATVEADRKGDAKRGKIKHKGKVDD